MSPPQEAVDVGVKAGLSIVESSILGAFAMLCLTVAALCLWVTMRTQDSRVADQKAMANKMEGLIREQGTFNSTTTAAIQKLNGSEQEQLQKLAGIQTQLSTITSGLMKGGG